jgi:hypothetical protein
LAVHIWGVVDNDSVIFRLIKKKERTQIKRRKKTRRKIVNINFWTFFFLRNYICRLFYINKKKSLRTIFPNYKIYGKVNTNFTLNFYTSLIFLIIPLTTAYIYYISAINNSPLTAPSFKYGQIVTILIS